MQRAGLVGAGLVMGGGGLVACSPGMGQSPNQDVDILNFALNLEYLEAAFYLAAVGRIGEIRNLGGSAEIRLPQGFDGTQPVPGLSQDVLEYAEEIALYHPTLACTRVEAPEKAFGRRHLVGA